MKDNITLGEVKAHCIEMVKRHGNDKCCVHCNFADLDCCYPPENWNLENSDLKCAPSQPDWEEMFHKSEESCRQMYLKMEDAHRRADRADEEIRRLRTIVNTVETILGRKFEV